MPSRRKTTPIRTPAQPTSSPRMKNGWFGYVLCAKPQMNAGRTTATQPGAKRRTNGIENIRDENSSVVAGRKPMSRTPSHGNEVPRRLEYGTSAGAHAPKRSAVR